MTHNAVKVAMRGLRKLRDTEPRKRVKDQITSLILQLEDIYPTPVVQCARPDCGKPFAQTRPDKIFCSYNCAHLVSIRRVRNQ